LGETKKIPGTGRGGRGQQKEPLVRCLAGEILKWKTRRPVTPEKAEARWGGGRGGLCGRPTCAKEKEKARIQKRDVESSELKAAQERVDGLGEKKRKLSRLT